VKKIILVGFIALLSCNQVEENDSSLDTQLNEITKVDAKEEIEKGPDRTQYIDEEIAGELLLSFEGKEQDAFVNDADETYIIQLYEGILMKASGAAAGFSLRFSPYDFWDEEMEMLVESKYDSDLDVLLSKEQNEVLGFVDFTHETKNIAWDYFENLFKIYYYEKEGLKYPLKFINEGKTDWDG
jgi:hypothetical protein